MNNLQEKLFHDTLLPKLDIHPVDEEVFLYPNCSARKSGLDGIMLSIVTGKDYVGFVYMAKRASQAD